MDIKAKVDEVVSKVKDDPNFASEFQSNPIGAVEKVIGIDLPDDVINNVIDGVKAKISLGDIGDKIGGLFGGLKK